MIAHWMTGFNSVLSSTFDVLGCWLAKIDFILKATNLCSLVLRRKLLIPSLSYFSKTVDTVFDSFRIITALNSYSTVCNK